MSRSFSSFSFPFFSPRNWLFFALLITVPPSPKQVRAAPRSRFRPIVSCIPECCTSAISVHYVHTPVHCYTFVSANHICKKGRRVKPPFTESAQTTVLLVIMVIKQMSSAYRDVNNEGSALTKSFRLVSTRLDSRMFKITLAYLYPLPAF